MCIWGFFTCYLNLFQLFQIRALWAKWRGAKRMSYPQWCTENSGETEGQTIFRVNKKHSGDCLHFIFALFPQCSMIHVLKNTHRPKTRSSAVSTSNGLMKAILCIEDLVTTFITFITADTDFAFFNSILITRVTHPLCPGLGKANNFSFFTFWLKKHLNV